MNLFRLIQSTLEIDFAYLFLIICICFLKNHTQILCYLFEMFHVISNFSTKTITELVIVAKRQSILTIRSMRRVFRILECDNLESGELLRTESS